jgi:LacI family transcriptional regulator
MPTVLFTQEHEGFDSVSVAHDKGGELVGNHLLDIGYDRFAFIGGEDNPKFSGFRRALRTRGLDIPTENILPTESWGGDVARSSYEVGIKFFGRRGERPPANAVFSVNDIAAFGMLHALQELGLRVPDDVALVGFDNTFISLGTRPTLTTVAQPMEEIGRTMVELLLSRIGVDEKKEPAQLRLNPRLIVRQSTRGLDV